MKYLVLAAALLQLFFQDLEAAAQNYTPMALGNTWICQTPNGKVKKEILEQKLTHNGIEYFQEESKSRSGNVTNYFRIDSQGNRWYIDPVSMKESIDIPGELKAGYTWTRTDGAWEYEIHKLDEDFKSPEKTIENCLVIKARQLTGRDKNKAGLYTISSQIISDT